MKEYVQAFTRGGSKVFYLRSLMVDSKVVDPDFRDGESQKKNFPKGFTGMGDKGFGDLLNDTIKTGDHLLVSQKFKELLEQEKVKNNEYYPVSLISGKKKKIIADNYFLVHQLGRPDCIDLEKSVFERNPLKRDQFISMEKCVFKSIEADLLMIRPKYYPYGLFIEKNLANKINEAGITGIGFNDLQAFDQFRKL